MTVTADSSRTADSHCWTADGRVVCIDAEIFEPLYVQIVSVSVTADSTRYTADSTLWTADGLAVVGAAVSGATDTFDAIVQVAGAAVLVEAAAALDALDATVEAAEVPVVIGGGARYQQRRPLPIYGIGYGILPQLVGEAYGVVGVAGKSAAQVLVWADAAGACGQAGDAAAVLKALAVAGNGAVGTRGSGDGVIVKFSGSATGRQDDDEAAAVIAFLLAA